MSVRDGKDLMMCRGSRDLWSWFSTTPNLLHPGAKAGRGAGDRERAKPTDLAGASGTRRWSPACPSSCKTPSLRGALNITFASQPSGDALGLGRIPKPVLSLSILPLFFFPFLPFLTVQRGLKSSAASPRSEILKIVQLWQETK